MPSECDKEHEKRGEVIEIWKIVVEVQQHFNDISMRIRGMFVTILLALFASIGFLLDKKLSLELLHLRIQFTTLVPLFGIVGTWLFYFMDRYWYHRLLVGSVKHAIEIEKKYAATLPELSLSQAIGKESPYQPRGIVRWAAKVLVRDDRLRQTGHLHSDGKIELFYKSVVVVLVLTALLLAVFGGVRIEKKAPSAPSIPAASMIAAPPHASPPTATRAPSATYTSPELPPPVAPPKAAKRQ